jgi:hypothetical protein
MHAYPAKIDALCLPAPLAAARCAVETMPLSLTALLSGIDAIDDGRAVVVLRALVLSLALIGLLIIVG